MSSQKLNTREQIIRNLMVSIRKEIRAASLFVHTMSEITGMHPTDIKCLDFLSDVKSATAGELAKITGLTTGAITAVIDRLEKIGFVKREADSKDRRKIIVRIIEEHPNNLELVRNIFADKLPNNLSAYKDEELNLIINWNEKLSDIFHGEIKKFKIQKKSN
ncbi:MAG: MarR family transcriptional regulator [Candidatus Pacebacteria bacterium]|nr:MarR family transcriptional regulator [Candidatus Paceibacterota bacterium]